MGRFVQGIAGAVFIFLVAGMCGCGGGATAVVQRPQAADFSVAVSSNAVSISQGGVSAPVSFSIIPHNGFSGSVQVTLAGLPAGASSNPASPFTITTGIDTSVGSGCANCLSQIGGYEYVDRGFAGGAERSPAVNANQGERRDCYRGRCGHRQLVTNFSRLASSKLTTTRTHSIFGAKDADSQTR